MAYDDHCIATGIHRQILSANTTASTAVAATAGTGGLQHPLAPLIHEDIMWQMNLSVDETMEAGPYPERPGQPDCAYYMKTGLCKFGMTCRFNHPPNRKLAIAAARMKGSYPERIGQPECQYYLKTGTCKFGATCKFHHPREKAGLASKVQLNDLGYPLRPNEIECAYYLRTGQCKFGNTCKFHHPQPSDLMVPISGSIYPTVHSPSTAQHSYPGALSNWSMPRASYIPSPRWQGPSSYAPMILPQGLVQVSGWNAYTGQLGSASSSQNQQNTQGSAQFYGSSRNSEISSAGSPGVFSSYGMGSIPVGLYGLQREGVFPERPGEPECQFYMKTGDCKYGAVCRFHHPRERVVPIPDCMLSSLGLPLRPGEPVCVFYSRYGICKFGSNCKFDHPSTSFPYGINTSLSTNIPVKSFVGSSSGTPALPLSQGPASADAKISRRLSLSEPRKLVSDEETTEAEA